MNSRRILPRAVLATAVATVIVVAIAYRDRLDVETFEAWRVGFDLLAPLVYLALYTVGTGAFMPGFWPSDYSRPSRSCRPCCTSCAAAKRLWQAPGLLRTSMTLISVAATAIPERQPKHPDRRQHGKG